MRNEVNISFYLFVSGSLIKISHPERGSCFYMNSFFSLNLPYFTTDEVIYMLSNSSFDTNMRLLFSFNIAVRLDIIWKCLNIQLYSYNVPKKFELF